MKVTHVSTEQLTDPRQIGWIGYKEGEATLYVKVIRGRGKTPFLSHPVTHALGVTWPVVVYENAAFWKTVSGELLRYFREHVGDDYFFNAQPRQKTIATPSPKG